LKVCSMKDIVWQLISIAFGLTQGTGIFPTALVVACFAVVVFTDLLPSLTTEDGFHLQNQIEISWLWMFLVVACYVKGYLQAIG